MDPHEDPEARIRELERPLADGARTSELGTQPYGFEGAYPPPPSAPPPPPPPPPAYGVPYPPFPQQAPKSSHAGLVIALVVGAVVIVGAMAVGAGVYFISGSGSDFNDPTSNPGVVGGGGELDDTPPTPPSASESETAVAIPSVQPTIPGSEVVPPAPPPPGEQISVSGISQNRTIDCNNCLVSVSGFTNTVVIRGHCVNLTVSGIENMVTVDTADTIGASGFDNRVTYHSGSPQISNSGGSNIVEQG